MAVATKQIAGDVVLPDATGSPGGKIEIKLSQPGYADDAGTDQLVAGEIVVAIGADGAVDFYLVPNDAITPAGTYYKAVFHLPDGTMFTKYWDVPSAGGALDIGAVPEKADLALVEPVTSSLTRVTVLPAASADLLGEVRYLTQQYGDYEPAIYVCLEDPDNAGVYDWIFWTGWPAE